MEGAALKQQPRLTSVLKGRADLRAHTLMHMCLKPIGKHSRCNGASEVRQQPWPLWRVSFAQIHFQSQTA